MLPADQIVSLLPRFDVHFDMYIINVRCGGQLMRCVFVGVMPAVNLMPCAWSVSGYGHVFV